MKLYYVVGSPNCRKVHAVLNHLNLKVDFEYMDFFAGDLQTPGYRAVNPNGMVPSLVDGDLTLWESNAIMQYLADKAGADDLFPRDTKRRADIQRWLAWELVHFNRAFGILSFETVAKPAFMKMEPHAPVAAWAGEQLKAFAGVLDAQMKGRTFVSGDGITLADYAMIHLDGFKEMMPFDWAPYPNVNNYFERMRQVEHWAKTAPARPELMGRKPQAA